MPPDRMIDDVLPLIKYSLCAKCDYLKKDSCTGDVEKFPFFKGRCREHESKPFAESKIYDYITDFFKLVFESGSNITRIAKRIKEGNLDITGYLSGGLKDVWNKHLYGQIQSIKATKKYYIVVYMKNKVRELLRG